MEFELAPVMVMATAGIMVLIVGLIVQHTKMTRQAMRVPAPRVRHTTRAVAQKSDVDLNEQHETEEEEEELPIMSCIRERASVFPRSYVDKVPKWGSQVPKWIIDRLLEAAMWAPFHGPVPPWRFVVLGKSATLDMQHMTIDFYDRNWRDIDWKGVRGDEAGYRTWRAKATNDIDNRWSLVSYMIAIVVRRQAGSKRMQMWEEECATACAVQNMHLQASAYKGLACYWSSWHSAARDSQDMRDYLKMDDEDKCLGFFMVGMCDETITVRRSRKPETHLDVEWRCGTE